MAQEISGKIQGLNASALRDLRRIGSKNLSPQEWVSLELLRAMGRSASRLRSMVGVLVDRKGSIKKTILGEATRLYLPDIGRTRGGTDRLRGLRLIVMVPVRQDHPSRRPIDVNSDFYTDCEKLRLDSVVIFEAYGEGYAGRGAWLYLENAGHQSQITRQELKGPQELGHDFQSWVGAQEDALSKIWSSNLEPDHRDHAIIVSAFTDSRHAHSQRMGEILELAKTAGVQVLDTIIQRRTKIDAKTRIGPGKLEDVSLHALSLGVDLLIFAEDLSPSQLNAITEISDLRVLDRTMLILDIFARHAKSRGGKLQVELAQARYSMPRLAKKQSGLSRLTGGIGGVGPGETKLEIDRRRLRTRIRRLEKEIDTLAAQREARRERRERRRVPVVALVGYTNAGKSTLLNSLTNSDVMAEDKLFATLDPTARRIRFPEERELVLVDTVGFIRELPTALRNAFRATLDEIRSADLLLHIVDIADDGYQERIQAVETILSELVSDSTPRLLCLNKCDQLSPNQAQKIEADLDGLMIRANFKPSLSALLSTLEQQLEWNLQSLVLSKPNKKEAPKWTPHD